MGEAFLFGFQLLTRIFIQGHSYIKQELRKKPEARQGFLMGQTHDILAKIENNSKDLLSSLLPGSVPGIPSKPFKAIGSAFFRSLDVMRETTHEITNIHSVPGADLFFQYFDKSISHIVALNEDMGSVDCYERRRTRILGKDAPTVDDDEDAKENLPVIHPIVDSRLKDAAGVAV